MALKIYYAKIDALLEEAYMEKAMALLPTMRLAKVEKLKQESDRRRSIAAGVLLELVLREQGLKGCELTFLTNEDGKPCFLERPELHYNLSHSGDYVALAIGNQEVGVDIEKLRENQQKLVGRFFSKEEQSFLADSWSDGAFTKLWTRKESYVKALGCGMRGLSGELSVLEDKVGGYYLKSFPINESYWLSVCQKEIPIEEQPMEVDLAQGIDALWDLD